ncbi:TrlF family AAA-like ATPase [Tenacibaculum mesophilum]|uniref:TrlF family AAA-like ATPase n=1 Tax=Tenacibaculum mesophilum TaxID=104268 RepID=UPI0024934661|nr:AAA family ATPase [Tenacibaculum mesophilum]
MINKGSEWNKWNFHVHTKGTNKNDQFESKSIDIFFYKFFKKAYENKVNAIGITDYFSIEKYLEAVNYVDNIENKLSDDKSKLFSEDEVTFIKSIFLFPNVELRMLPSTDKARLINIHCLFNPDYVKHLENDFFAHIENQDNHKMNRHGLTEYGRSLDDSLTDPKSLYKKGIDNYVIDLKSLKRIVDNNVNFKNNCLFVVSNSNNDGASAIQKHYNLFENEGGALDGLRKSIYKLSHAIFSTNERDIKYFLGKRLEGTEEYTDDIYKKEVEEVIKQRGSLKACIVGCDSHTENTLFNKFTWVKSKLSFEGLRQICFEPEQRVKIQSDKPEFKEDKVIISSVKFDSENKIFTSNEISLNPNLNVIIGGKSSGKSILLYSIAKTLLPDNSILKNENGEEKYNLKSIDPKFNFQITTQSGISQKMFRNEEENSVIPDIKYIPQNYLVKLAEPEINKKGKSLNKLVRDLINEDFNSKDKYDQFIKNVKENDQTRERLINNYFQTLDDITKLEADLKTKSNKEVLEKNIATNTEQVEKLNKESGLSDEQVKEYKEIQKRISSYEERKTAFNEDFTSINSNLNQIRKLINETLTAKKDFLTNIKTNEIKEFYTSELLSLDEMNTLINTSISQIEIETDESGKKSFKNDNILKTHLSTLIQEKKSLDKELEPFQQNENLKKKIETLNESITSDKKLLSNITSLNKNILEKKNSLKTLKEDIFTLYESTYNEYLKVILELKERTQQLERDGLKINGISQFNFKKFRKKMLDISDGRQASYNNYNILNQSKKSTDNTVFRDIKKEIETIFSDLMSNKYSILSRIDKKHAIKLLLDDYFFDFWKIIYKNDRLGEMSTGKASFVILMLIIGLSKSKSPILIDQPEDNLDNRSITSDLVYYLKNKKLERQIIIVTHNANIVVNSDSENVIVANQKGQNETKSSSDFKFDYINGAIEDTFEKNESETDLLKSMGIREHIADIVEGGKTAFISREKKYRFEKNIA